jgi:hypothetical protein
MEVSIIIVNYNTREFLRRCLDSIFSFPPRREFEVMVADNGSTDPSVGMVRETFPQVEVIGNRTNRGFSAALNRGLRKSKGDLLLVLNPDVVLAPGCIDAMADFMDRHTEAGICGPKLLNPDGSIQLSRRAFPNPVNVFFGRRSLWNRFFPKNKISRSFLRTDLDYDSVQEVDWVIGACMMIKKGVIKSVGLFDEDYFLFVEDTDFCYRARKAGYDVFYVPHGVATHERGASTRKSFVMSTYKHNLGMYKFFNKHYNLNPIARAVLAFGLVARLLVVIPVEGIQRSM